jgi:hypothetical protein
MTITGAQIKAARQLLRPALGRMLQVTANLSEDKRRFRHHLVSWH